MTGKPTKGTAIPDFGSIQQEAEFWDTHDFTEYTEGFELVSVRFAKKLSDGITLRLDPGAAADLRALARERGVLPSTLARAWVLEHLRRERAS